VKGIQNISQKKDFDERDSQRHAYIANHQYALLIEQDNRIRYASPGAYKILGYSEKTLSSKSFIDLILPSNITIIDEYDKNIERKVHVNVFGAVTGGGKIKWIETHAATIQWRAKSAKIYFIKEFQIKALQNT